MFLTFIIRLFCVCVCVCVSQFYLLYYILLQTMWIFIQVYRISIAATVLF